MLFKNRSKPHLVYEFEKRICGRNEIHSSNFYPISKATHISEPQLCAIKSVSNQIRIFTTAKLARSLGCSEDATISVYVRV